MVYSEYSASYLQIKLLFLVFHIYQRKELINLPRVLGLFNR